MWTHISLSRNSNLPPKQKIFLTRCQQRPAVTIIMLHEIAVYHDLTEIYFNVFGTSQKIHLANRLYTYLYSVNDKPYLIDYVCLDKAICVVKYLI